MADVFPKIQIIDGIPVSKNYDVETFRSALNYKAQPDDIFLCTFPKSGTTWAQVILYALTHNGEAFDSNMAEYFASTPTLEQVGERGIKSMRQPYVIKTHLPLNRISYSEKAKYVCIIRNPKDVCVSYYYFLLKMVDAEPDKTSFDAFFEAFLSGNIHFGNYFDHLHAIWQRKDNTNIFLTSYEEMKHDLGAVVRQLAQFLNIELNDNLYERILTYSSFDYMKERYDKAYLAQARILLANESSTNSCPINKTNLTNYNKLELVRKGTVGGWSSIMNEEQFKRLDKIFVEKTKDMVGLDKLFLPSQP